MRLDRFVTLYLARPIRALAPIAAGSRVRILMYHRISSDPEPGVSPYYRLNTSPNRFAEQMQFLADSGYSVIDLPTALDSIEAGSNDRKEVVLTFDDGYADFAEHAFLVLQKHHFTATIFLPTAYIGETPLRFKSASCLSWSEVKDLRKAGISFGSHTVNHPKLWELSWDDIDRELSVSRETLENQLQEPIETFAHPYAFPETDASYLRRFAAALRRHGYRSCATTRIGIARAGDDSLSLKRLPVNDCDDLPLFRAKLEGGYDWLAIPQRLRKRQKAKPAPLPSIRAAEPVS